MNKLNEYKKPIFTFVTIFLLVTYGIFPALTAANTFLNILGGIGALLFLIWGGLELYEYVKNSDGFVDKKELEEATELLKKKTETKTKKKASPKVNKNKLKEN